MSKKHIRRFSHQSRKSCKAAVLFSIGIFYFVEAYWAWHDALILIACGHMIEAALEMLDEKDKPPALII